MNRVFCFFKQSTKKEIKVKYILSVRWLKILNYSSISSWLVFGGMEYWLCKLV